jgi:2-oxoglutarate ferredoxin oxidoreductase subunit delta
MRFWRRPLDEGKVLVEHGRVHIIVERCKGCGFCVEFCPLDVLATSDSFNSKGYHPPVIVRPEACVRCGLCEIICPEFAVYVLRDGERPAQVRRNETLHTP